MCRESRADLSLGSILFYVSNPRIIFIHPWPWVKCSFKCSEIHELLFYASPVGHIFLPFFPLETIHDGENITSPTPNPALTLAVPNLVSLCSNQDRLFRINHFFLVVNCQTKDISFINVLLCLYPRRNALCVASGSTPTTSVSLFFF